MLELLQQSFLLPPWFWYGAIGIFGAIIGSFLNVYIYRFHTGKSLNGRSHCLSCGTTLRWFELLPVISYLYQRGRCRTCGSYITPRYLIVELITIGLFMAALVVASSPVELVWLLAVLVVLIVITVYDYYHFIIPDELTIALTGLLLTWLGYSWWSGSRIEHVLWDVGASLAAAAFFYLLWVVTKGRGLGFGDVKLAVPLALLVGQEYVFSFVVLSFWVGAIVSVGILVFQYMKRGQQQLHLSQQTLTMKSAVPFAPFMIVGALLTYFYTLNVLAWFSFT